MADIKTTLEVKDIAGKPLVSDPEKFEMPLELMNFYGKTLVAEISKEAKIAAKKFSIVPDTPKFYNSFSYKVLGKEVRVVTSWPWVDPLIQGTPKFPMTWLTQEKGVTKVPIFQKDGTVVIRTAPLTVKDAWIHPAIAKHTFLQKGIESAKVLTLKKAMESPGIIDWVNRLLAKLF
jgi:hypothetical protein